MKGRTPWLVASAVVSAGAVGIWLRQAVLPFQGLEPSPALAVIRTLHTRGGVSAADGRLLYDEVLRGRYTRGLDLGTAEGYGALWMSMALRRNGGVLVTVEIDGERARKARENFRRAEMDAVISLHVADALQEIPRLPGDFDFVFMDLGVPLNMRLFGMLRERVRPGGEVMAHNAESFRWTQPDFLHAITTDPAFDTSFHGWIFRMSRSVKRR
jgi:predicted O-methyltransferase YrrM